MPVMTPITQRTKAIFLLETALNLSLTATANASSNEKALSIPSVNTITKNITAIRVLSAGRSEIAIGNVTKASAGPPATTSVTGTPCCNAIYPRVPKTTNPDMMLTMKFPAATQTTLFVISDLTVFKLPYATITPNAKDKLKNTCENAPIHNWGSKSAPHSGTRKSFIPSAAPSSVTALTNKIAKITNGNVAVQTTTLLTLLTPFQTQKYSATQAINAPVNTPHAIPPRLPTPSESLRTSLKKNVEVSAPHPRLNEDAR